MKSRIAKLCVAGLRILAAGQIPAQEAAATLLAPGRFAARATLRKETKR